MLGRKIGFWVAVGGVAILAQFAVELVADKAPIPGLRRFVDYIHCGPGGAGKGQS